jgi:DNA polymerase I
VTREEEWLWGWDATPGIVSVWADGSGRALVWRRLSPGHVVCEQERFRPWLLLSSLDFLEASARERLTHATAPERPGSFRYTELSGAGQLRYRVDADELTSLSAAVLQGARRRLGGEQRQLRDLGADVVLALSPEEQYLVASGRTYFGGMAFDDLERLALDLETTGLDARTDRIFLVALCHSNGSSEVLESRGGGDRAEADLLKELGARIGALDPDVIENHNLHGFDLPFIVERARVLGVPLALGRAPGLAQRAASRGGAPWVSGGRSMRRRYTLPGRECIDTLDAVRRHDFSARDLPGHGLKAVARHFGIAAHERVYVPGSEVFRLYRVDPERVRRYAQDDAIEASRLARLLGGAAFALAQMAPRRYERLADAGAATGVIDPLLLRAYLRSGAALPAPAPGDGTEHTGAGLHLFSTGVATRVVKADVASLYPSLMRQYAIGPSSDRLGVLLGLIARLVDQRLDAKRRARTFAPGSSERHALEAISAAMKLVVNSAYGYLGAVGLTRFADVHAANEVTRRGRELLDLLCQQLLSRGVTLLEADTDGVYFAVPEGFDEADERRVVSEIAALLPERVALELEGRYSAMLSHEPKNYALLTYGGQVQVRGVAFRSSRLEAYGTAFLHRALQHLLSGDVPGVRTVYVEALLAVRRRAVPTANVSTRARLTKTPEQYRALRAQRRELTYEAVLASGQTQWRVGDHVRVYRATGGRAALLGAADDLDATSGEDPGASDARDYDSAYYARLLRDTFATRLVRAFTPDDFARVFADPEQPSLFDRELSDVRPVLTRLHAPER